jgi:serine/threonine-protein kinase HipA
MAATSSRPTVAFVWVWLPGATEPVVAGRLDTSPESDLVSFTYGRRYLARPDAMALYLPDLPLVAGVHAPRAGRVPGPIADAGPDGWGCRVIEARHAAGGGTDATDLGILTLLLESGSDRIGALDFQRSPEEYVARTGGDATLAELAEAASKVEAGVPLSSALDRALLHGTSVGGARPKALLTDGARRLIAKFSSSTDTAPVVQGEYLAMELARRAGLRVAPVEMARALGRHVLLVERFDRTADGGRRAVVSGLTILGLDELAGRYASYADLADHVRAGFTDAEATLRELFARITFNILVSNNDDHARNHAALWDGSLLTLSPAYDICPQPRAGGETTQAMAIGRDGYRYARLAGCVARADTFLLKASEARDIIDRQVEAITEHWDEVCDRAELVAVDRTRLRQRQFLNPYAFEGY